MSERKRIACFFTAGYTELNSMKLFIKKISSQFDYIQLCPTGSRKSKKQIIGRHIDTIESKHNGLTGEALINYVLDFIQKKRFQDESYDAILIEDDKDDRFLSPKADGTTFLNISAWNDFKQDVTGKVHAIYPDIPVLFFFAAPEVESWFIADWDNSFGKAYKNILTTEQNKYFSVCFRKYVNDYILTQRYSNSIEEYGYFNGSYKKLSEEIQNILEKKDFLHDIWPTEEHKPIRYSKKMQGEMMLETIDPQIVAEKCSVFFKRALFDLQNLNMTLKTAL